MVSIDFTGDLSTSFKVTSAEAGGLTISLATLSISVDTVTGPILDTLHFDVSVIALSALMKNNNRPPALIFKQIRMRI